MNAPEPPRPPDLQRVIALATLSRWPEAIVACDEFLRHQPENADAIRLRGLLALELQDIAYALTCFDRVVTVRPNDPQPRRELADAQFRAGLFLESLRNFDVALQSMPRDAHTLNARANVLSALDRHTEALVGYDRAILSTPNFAAAYMNRGNVQLALRQFEAALMSCEQALALDPRLPNAHYNRGNVLLASGRIEEAVVAYNQEIALRPDHFASHYNRGNALYDLKQYDLALAAYQAAARLNPTQPGLHGLILHTMQLLCDWRELDHTWTALTAALEHGIPVSDPKAILSLSHSPGQQRLAAEVWTNKFYPPDVRLGPALLPPPRQRLRVGYFSADFHDHATTYLIAELFELHNRDRFEVFAFSFGRERRDQMRRRIVQGVDHFFEVSDLSDLAVARLAREHAIDIAVDLKGYTQDHRLGIFAARAAPIQVGYLGFPATVGATYLDYIVADSTLIPPASRAHFVEKVITLPDSYQVNDSQRAVANRPFSRRECGLPDGAFIFCCFNSSYKITRATFGSWMNILRRVPRSVIWLLADSRAAIANLRREALSHQIAPERLIFGARMALSEYLARLRLADLFLDTRPYNAHTTASDALWAGLPVLTWIDDSFAGRVASSLLRAANLPELVTNSQREYEDMAVALTSNPDQLFSLRRRLDEHRHTVPLFDSRRLTRNLEAAYEIIWQRAHEGLEPDHIDIVASADIVENAGN